MQFLAFFRDPVPGPGDAKNREISGPILAKKSPTRARRLPGAKTSPQRPRATRFLAQIWPFFRFSGGRKRPKNRDFGGFWGVPGPRPGGAKNPQNRENPHFPDFCILEPKIGRENALFRGPPRERIFGPPGPPGPGPPRRPQGPPRPGGPRPAEPSRHS